MPNHEKAKTAYAVLNGNPTHDERKKYAKIFKDYISECEKFENDHSPEKHDRIAVGQAVRLTKVDCPTLLLNDVMVGSKGIVVDIPGDGTIEVFILDMHQGWFFMANEIEPWKEGK